MSLPTDSVPTTDPQGQGKDRSSGSWDNTMALAWLWRMMRPFLWHVLVLIWVPVAWAVGLSLTSFVIQQMVKSISEHQDSLILPMIFFVAIRVVLISNYRLYDYVINIRMIPALRQRIGLEITREIFNKHYPYFQIHQAGALGSKINDLMRNVPNLLEVISQELFGNTLAVIIAIATLTSFQSIFGGLMAFWAISVMGISWLSSQRFLNLSHQLFQKGSILTGKIVDILGNILSVRLFSHSHREDHVLSHAMTDFVDQEKIMERHYFQMRSINSLISIGVLVANGYFLCQGYEQGTIDAGGLVFVLTVNRSVMDFLWRFDQIFSNISEYYGSITQSLQTVIGEKSADEEKALPDLHLKKGEIVFSNVNFSYPECPILFKNLSLHIRAGEKVGIVGRSGSGKSTFAHILLRLYPIQGGTIYIDGQNIMETRLHSIYDHITLVPQESSLFERSLKDNVLYANPLASLSDVEHAFQASCCETFIQQLPNGADTFIGAHGVRLSGGQKQRIAIARAMLRDSGILILDETTSQLDSVTEALLQDRMWQFFGHKTVLVIAHRLSTLRRMDRILVFDQGQVVEQGSHEELLAKNGLYAMMWKKQDEDSVDDKIE